MACVAWSSLRMKTMLGRCAVCCAIADNADRASVPMVRFLFIAALFCSFTLSLYREGSFIAVIIGALGNPQLVAARLSFLLHIDAIESQILRSQLKGDLPALSRLQCDLLKSFQLFHRPG